jgi:hypothetical protein
MFQKMTIAKLFIDRQKSRIDLTICAGALPQPATVPLIFPVPAGKRWLAIQGRLRYPIIEYHTAGI